MLHQIVDHAGTWLPPGMIFEIAGDGARGMMRAIPDVVDHGALGSELGAHPVVQALTSISVKYPRATPDWLVNKNTK